MTTFSGIILKGSYPEVLFAYEKYFAFEGKAVGRKFTNFQAFERALFERTYAGITARGVLVLENSTLIIDPELIDCFEKKTLINLSQHLQAEIFTCMIQTTSGSFAFAKYHKTLLREFISIEGNIQADFGSPLEEEAGLPIKESIFTEDIFTLAKNFGIDLVSIHQRNFFILREWQDASMT